MNVSSPKLLLFGNVNITILSLRVWTVFRKLSVLLLISNFRRVLNVVFFLLGDSPASEFCVDVSEHTSIFIGGVNILPAYTAYEVGTGCSERRHIKLRRRGITQKKEYNNQWCLCPTLPCQLLGLTPCFIDVPTEY
jgi:hypothetical protein